MPSPSHCLWQWVPPSPLKGEGVVGCVRPLFGEEKGDGAEEEAAERIGRVSGYADAAAEVAGGSGGAEAVRCGAEAGVSGVVFGDQ